MPIPHWQSPWDEQVETTPEAIAVLSISATHTEQWLYTIAHDRYLNREFLCDIHRMLFGKVFPNGAGRVRHNATGFDQPVTFNGLSGSHYRDIPEHLAHWEQEVRRMTNDLDRMFDEEGTERHLLDIATVNAWAHHRFTQIHPFINGNGRTARAISNYFAYRFGLQPLELVRDRSAGPESPYIRALSGWSKFDEHQPLIDYMLENMPMLPPPDEEPEEE